MEGLTPTLFNWTHHCWSLKSKANFQSSSLLIGKLFWAHWQVHAKGSVSVSKTIKPWPLHNYCSKFQELVGYPNPIAWFIYHCYPLRSAPAAFSRKNKWIKQSEIKNLPRLSLQSLFVTVKAAQVHFCSKCVNISAFVSQSVSQHRKDFVSKFLSE